MAIAKLKRVLDRSIEILLVITVGILVVDVLWQIFTRFVIRNPSSWTEEFATFLLMWVGLLGAGVALNRESHLGVDFITSKLPEKAKTGIEILVYALICVFSISVMMVGGVQLVHRTLTTDQISPALGLRMGYVYLCLPVSGFFIAFYSLFFLAQSVGRLFKKQEQTS